MHTTKIDVDYALENYEANFDTGSIYRKPTLEPIGSIGYNGSTRYRIYTTIRGLKVPNHRLLRVLWNECDVPTGFDVKHINKNQMDNRLINLSVASRTGSNKHRNAYRKPIWQLIDEAEAFVGQPLPYGNVETYRRVKAGGL